MKRVHPSDPSSAYSWSEWETWCKTLDWPVTKMQRIWDECLEDDILKKTPGKRMHPLGDGKSYTFLQTHEFCKYNLQVTEDLWQEMRIVKTNEAPDFGQWTPVDTMPLSKVRIYHPSDVHWDDPRKLVRRAWSEGQLMERQPSERHPHGHPTARAYDSSWIAAT